MKIGSLKNIVFQNLIFNSKSARKLYLKIWLNRKKKEAFLKSKLYLGEVIFEVSVLKYANIELLWTFKPSYKVRSDSQQKQKGFEESLKSQTKTFTQIIRLTILILFFIYAYQFGFVHSTCSKDIADLCYFITDIITNSESFGDLNESHILKKKLISDGIYSFKLLPIL